LRFTSASDVERFKWALITPLTFSRASSIFLAEESYLISDILRVRKSDEEIPMSSASKPMSFIFCKIVS